MTPAFVTLAAIALMAAAYALAKSIEIEPVLVSLWLAVAMRLAGELLCRAGLYLDGWLIGHWCDVLGLRLHGAALRRLVAIVENVRR